MNFIRYGEIANDTEFPLFVRLDHYHTIAIEALAIGIRFVIAANDNLFIWIKFVRVRFVALGIRAGG